MKRMPRRSRNAVTMHEVAKHVGVSPMMVSRVISGDANVRAETLLRVQGAIKELGYTPNVAARNLAKATTERLGQARYLGWSGELGAQITSGALTLASLTDLAAEKGFDPPPRSGRQELAESIIARHCKY